MAAPHLPLVRQCGACGDVIFRHERIIAMRGTDDSMAYSGEMTRPFPFPQHGMVRTQIGDWQPCRIPPRACPSCQEAPMVVAVHYDCLHVFEAEVPGEAASGAASDLDDAGRRRLRDSLWALGAWRRPWLHAVPPLLEDAGPGSYGDAELAAFARLAAVAGLQQLAKLPFELVCLVHALSSHSLFWRAVRCLATGRAARAAMRQKPDEATRISRTPLREIAMWTRGQSLTATDVKLLPPEPPYQPPMIIRITMDRQGICEIERLPIQPVFTRRTSRLCIWNTPSPPRGQACALFHTYRYRRVRLVQHHIPNQLYFVDTSRCFGLTFFSLHGRISGVHVHRTADDAATRTYEQLTDRIRMHMVWVYLPLPPQERIVALWALHSGNFGSRDCGMVIRTAMAGDISVGSIIGDAPKTKLVAHGQRLAFIYGEPHETQPVRIIGACPEDDGGTSADAQIQQPVRPPAVISVPRTLPVARYDPHVSSVPLCDVVAVRVFHVPARSGICRGLLLWYADGCVRTLGECRVGHDESWDVAEPAAICHRPVKYEAYGDGPDFDAVVVSVARTKKHAHDEDGWVCHGIGKGVLHSYVTRNRQYAMVYEA